MSRYSIRPKADADLDEQALYLATQGTSELGHRFLLAAHETFLLLQEQPQIGWSARLRDHRLEGLRIFSVKGFEKMLVLYLPVEQGIEVLRVVHGSRNLPLLLRREGIE